MRKAKNIFANIDSISVSLYVALMFFGWLNIYASQYNEDITFALDFSSRYGKQLFFIVIASVVAFLILIIDWKFYFSLSYISSHRNFRQISTMGFQTSLWEKSGCFFG